MPPRRTWGMASAPYVFYLPVVHNNLDIKPSFALAVLIIRIIKVEIVAAVDFSVFLIARKYIVLHDKRRTRCRLRADANVVVLKSVLQ